MENTATREEKHIKLLGWFWRLTRWAGFGFLAFLGYLWFFELPSFEELENPKSIMASEVLANDGSSLGRYYLENRVPVGFNELPRNLVDAVVATEDERYYSHSGIDARALGRVAKGVATGHLDGGGSTISQQLAKLLFERPKRENYNPISWKFVMAKTKLKEWLIAVQLERRYTKEEIIALYFNKFNFINGAYGIKTASEVYFGKAPKDLKIEESALLVGMLQNPSLYNPKRHYDRAMKRREIVLFQMKRKGLINQVQYDSLRKIPIDLSNFHLRDHKDGPAPYFREELRKEVAKILKDVKKPDGSNYDVYTDGLKVYTTINPKIQEYAEESVFEHFKMLQPQLFRHWAKLDPWSYKQEGVDDAEIVARKKILEGQIRNSDRYQVVRSKLMPIASEEELDLREVDIDRILEADTKGARIIDEWLKTKMIGADLAEKYRKALQPDKLRKLKGEFAKVQAATQTMFDTPVKMKVFAYKKPTMEKDTTMTPRDSVKYHRMHLQTGVMAVDPHNGNVLAWVGGPGFNWFKYDHVNQTAARQVGSTFKPYLYALSIQERGYSPCFTVADQQVCFPRGFMGLASGWCPSNADGGYSGASLTLYDALMYSRNTVSAYLMKDLGDTKPLRNFIARMGIDTSRVPAKPSICLGACEISVYEMTGAYATFANDGKYTKPIFITKIEDKNGNPIYEAVQEQTQVLSKGANYVMTKMLEHVVRGAKGTPDFADIKSTVGGKTGTTNYAADCWFMGITPNLVVGTWTGCDDRWIRFRDFTWGQGGKQARPIFSKLLHKLEKDPLSGYVVVDTGFVKPANMDIEPDCSKYRGTGAGLPSVIFEDSDPNKTKPAAPTTTPGAGGGEPKDEFQKP